MWDLGTIIVRNEAAALSVGHHVTHRTTGDVGTIKLIAGERATVKWANGRETIEHKTTLKQVMES